MKEKFQALLAKAQEHKTKLILIGGAVAGAVVGATVVAVAAHFQAQQEEIPADWEVEDEEEDLESEEE